MDLRILGLDPDEVDFEPDSNPGGLRETLPQGGDYLYLANDLLDLVAPEKGARLRHILEHDLLPDGNGQWLLPALDVGNIWTLLEDVDEEVLAVTDELWRLRPEHVEAVRSRYPDLVYTFTNADGHTVHTLENSVSFVLTLRAVLRNAVRRGLKVVLY